MQEEASNDKRNDSSRWLVMGTRADFYVGRGTEAEWLGSIGWDGYPDGVFALGQVLECPEEDWRAWVALFLTEHDGIKPAEGWPWPWEDSRTTDYAYAWDDGKVYGSNFGYEWFAVDMSAAEDFGQVESENKVAVFPDMTARRVVDYGPRSGLIIVSAPEATP